MLAGVKEKGTHREGDARVLAGVKEKGMFIRKSLMTRGHIGIGTHGYGDI